MFHVFALLTPGWIAFTVAALVVVALLLWLSRDTSVPYVQDREPCRSEPVEERWQVPTEDVPPARSEPTPTPEVKDKLDNRAGRPAPVSDPDPLPDIEFVNIAMTTSNPVQPPGTVTPPQEEHKPDYGRHHGHGGSTHQNKPGSLHHPAHHDNDVDDPVDWDDD